MDVHARRGVPFPPIPPERHGRWFQFDHELRLCTGTGAARRHLARQRMRATMNQLSPVLPNLSCSLRATMLGRRGESCLLDCVEEEAVAFRYNGFSHGVMMATSTDLEDFAYGFSLTEGVIAGAGDIDTLSISAAPDGVMIDVSLGGASLHRYLAARR